jgi:iron complex outermembrane receptor protein
MMYRVSRATLLATVALQFAFASEASAQSPDGVTADDTIIVTARRIEERLQDVPISISVVDQDRIDRANIVSGEDLAKVVPGLNVQSKYGAENANFAIRGFQQEIQTSSSVGTYFGEVVSPRSGSPAVQAGDGAGPGSLFDLQSVQVLKGPQGTLFGRNTTGGAVLLTPRKPVDRFEGYIEGSVGNYDMKRIQAVVNVPLADWARLRLGVDRQTRDGYAINAGKVGPRDFYDVDYVAARGALVLDLSPDIENYTIVSYMRSDTNGQMNQIFRANPLAGFGGLAKPQVDRYLASGNKYQVELSLSDPRVLTNVLQFINTTTWQAADNLTVKNIASYSTFKQILRQDLYGAAFYIPNATSPIGFVSAAFLLPPDNAHSANQKNITEELQFQGNALDTKLNYQFGLYYERSTPNGTVGSKLPNTGATCLFSEGKLISDFRCLPPGLQTGTGSLNDTIGSLRFINMAAYAQATYALTDQLKLTGGIRYTYDRSRGEATGRQYVFVSPPGGGFGQAVFARCQNNYDPVNCKRSASTSTQRPTWTLNVAYNATDDMMIYGTYSRGYRQGAAATFFSYPNRPSKFGPEKVDNFEAGVKTSFRGAVSGNLNVAAFYSNLTAQQLLVAAIDTNGSNGSATAIYNAGKSRVYGFEVDGSLRFSELFRLDAAATYVNSKLISADFPTVIPGYNTINPSALAGDPLPYTPKWGINVAGTFTLPIPEEYGRIDFSATYRFNSRYATGASILQTAYGDEVSQVDLSLDWRDVAGQPFDIGLFGSNITKQFTATGVAALYNSFGFDARYLGRPRMYGARVKWRFGSK